MASSSSSPQHNEIKHELFISFRGPDVRRGLLSHLKKELHREQIDVYVDERLERGDEISSALLRAIEGSKISLVIFSKDYASSTWCLEELAKIIECNERYQIVLPVFYNIDPTDVRNQNGEYGHALAKHEEKHKVKIPRWRDALKKAADFSGYHYPTQFEDESNLVDQIVKDVSKRLSEFCTSDSNDFVGNDKIIAQIESFLTMKPREVRILGIWGMPGIGKTTIARIVFDKFCEEYDGCCFLENVREENEQHGLHHLCEKLQFELLEGENLPTNGRNKARFFSSAKRKLSHKKVLIVLDDVHTSEQLKHLVGEPFCFGAGTRVIVTSRDNHVLMSGGVHEVQEVNQLNGQESLKLFCLHAFNSSQPKMEYEELCEKAIASAKGNPLALKVLGSYFHSKSKDIWECELKKLKKYPNKEIQSVLSLSYDGLDDLDKKVFLDVAFFFKEDDKDYVTRKLDDWGFHGTSGIYALQQKALLTISSDNKIKMHDLIQGMGWEIVRQESITYPERRSRLRNNDEVYDVLKNNLGTHAVEAIQIDISQIRDLSLSVDTFKKMPNLRFLKVYCPLHVELFVPPSYVIELLRRVQDILNVNKTDLSQSKLLVELPKLLYKTSILEYANLNDRHSLHDLVNLNDKASDLQQVLKCESLSDVHPSMCKELGSIGSEIHLKYIDYVLIDGYSCEKDFSASLMEIRQPNLTATGMEILNSTMLHLNNLESSDIDALQHSDLPDELLCLRSTSYLRLAKSRGQDNVKPKLHILFDGLICSRRISLTELHNFVQMVAPQNISVFTNLSSFSLDECKATRLIELPHDINTVPQLRVLTLDGSSVEKLPTSIKLLQKLEKLSLRGCRRLQSLPELPPSIEFLDVIGCILLGTVQLILNTAGPPGLMNDIYGLSQLRVLTLDGSSVEWLPTGIKRFQKLEELSLSGCRRLQSLPELPPTLKYLDISDCILLGTVEPILNTVGPPGLMDYICALSQLRVLRLDGSSVERLPTGFKLLQKLKVLSLRGCKSLQSLPELPPSIEILDASDCILLKTVEFSLNTSGLPDLQSFSQYAYISFRNCVRLVANYSFHQFVRALAYCYVKRITKAKGMGDFFFRPLLFCYLDSKVPEWFTYRTWGASITVELVPSTDLFSCLLCIVMSPSSSFFRVSVTCQSYVEDGNMPEYRFEIQEMKLDHYGIYGTDLEHAYILYSGCFDMLFRKNKAGRVNDYCTSSSYKVRLLFSFKVLGTLSSDREHKLDGLIKECGVCPLYHSDYDNFIKPNKHRDVFELESTRTGNEVGSTSD